MTAHEPHRSHQPREPHERHDPRERRDPRGSRGSRDPLYPRDPSYPGSGGAGLFVRVDGTPLHVRVEGRGPVCVLSAGLAMAWFDWDEVAAQLVAAGRTVVRFDRPGHGLSGPATAPPTTAGEAHRIAGLLDALGHGGPAAAPVTVVGHSIAAFHTEGFARLYPRRTAALVLLDASVEEDPRPLLPAALRTGAARALGRAVTAAGLPAALGPAVRRATVRASRTGGGDPAARDLVHRCYRTGRVWQGALLENSRYLDMAAELAALRRTRPLTAPATVLAGHDGSAGRGALRWLGRQADLADRIGARFEDAEPAGHLVMHDRPDQVARAVVETSERQRRE
ncbi:alpha/beta fold hydrolase [Streptomyces sp. NPDC054987]